MELAKNTLGGLTGQQLRIAQKILEVAQRSLGDAPRSEGKTFYSPDEWEERGEDYGRSALLVIVHDGGDFAPFFNGNYGLPHYGKDMVEGLQALGVHYEGCTCWYTAIYPNDSGVWGSRAFSKKLVTVSAAPSLRGWKEKITNKHRRQYEDTIPSPANGLAPDSDG
jgi:hypothetical protein